MVPQRLLLLLTLVVLSVQVTASYVQFLYFYRPDLWARKRGIFIETDNGDIQKMTWCGNKNGWYYKPILSDSDITTVNVTVDLKACGPCEGIPAVFDGGFALVADADGCGCGTLDYNFVPNNTLVGNLCMPKIKQVYYQNTRWWNSYKEVFAMAETGITDTSRISTLRCSTEGWFSALLPTTNSTSGFVFEADGAIDYAQCGTENKYSTKFDGSMVALFTTPNNCGGSLTTNFDASQVGECIKYSDVVFPTDPPTVPPSEEPTPTPTKEPTNLILVMTAPAAVIGFLILVLAAYLIFIKVRDCRRRRNKKALKDVESSMSLKPLADARNPVNVDNSRRRVVSFGNTWVNTKYEAVTLPGYLLIDRDRQLQVQGLMTSGGGGAIYYGKLLDSHLIYENDGKVEVVVKDLTAIKSLSEGENRLLFHQEVAAMGSLRTNQYVARLIGFTEKPRSIVTPLYRGDLHALIHSQSYFESCPMDLELDFLLRLIFQMATALQACHAMGVIHRDVKTKNFLLEDTNSRDAPFRIKLSDFGICRIMDDSIKKRPLLNIFGISPRYAAPEVYGRMLRPELELAPEDEKKADVYAFGICVWEMFMRMPPWNGVSSEDVQNLVVSGERPKFEGLNEDNDDELLFQNMATDSWHQFPRDRPTFADLVAFLHHFRPDICEP